MNIGTPEVRNTNQTVNISSPTIDREQQDCEICHKVNHADEMLLCDGCDCGEEICVADVISEPDQHL